MTSQNQHCCCGTSLIQTQCLYVYICIVGDAQGRCRNEWYFYVFFVSFVAVVSKEQESKGKRNTESMRKTEGRLRDVKVKDGVVRVWDSYEARGKCLWWVHLRCWKDVQYLRCYREAYAADLSITLLVGKWSNRIWHAQWDWNRAAEDEMEAVLFPTSHSLL